MVSYIISAYGQILFNKIYIAECFLYYSIRYLQAKTKGFKVRLFRKKDRGPEILDIQTKLVALGYKIGSSGPDGVFGQKTEEAIRKFQKDRNINVDGIVGPDTWQKLVEASYHLGDRTLYLHSPFLRGDDIHKLQTILNSMGFNCGMIDGIFGPKTEESVREFQKSTGIQSDGIVGTSTIQALKNLRRLHEKEIVTEHPGIKNDKQVAAFKIFEGRRIVIDYLIEPGDIVTTFDDKLVKKFIEEIALRVGNLINLIGGEAKLFFRPGRYGSLIRRIRKINRTRPDVIIVVSLFQNNDKDISCQINYFQEGNYVSKNGFRLAECVEENLNELKNKNRGILLGDSSNILKKTLAPAIIARIINLADQDEISLVDDEIYRQKIAVALFDGLKLYFSEE